jgi:hypothetical protein
VAEEDPALAVSVAAKGEKEKNNSLPHKPKNPPQLDRFVPLSDLYQGLW